MIESRYWPVLVLFAGFFWQLCLLAPVLTPLALAALLAVPVAAALNVLIGYAQARCRGSSLFGAQAGTAEGS